MSLFPAYAASTGNGAGSESSSSSPESANGLRQKDAAAAPGEEKAAAPPTFTLPPRTARSPSPRTPPCARSSTRPADRDRHRRRRRSRSRSASPLSVSASTSGGRRRRRRRASSSRSSSAEGRRRRRKRKRSHDSPRQQRRRRSRSRSRGRKKLGKKKGRRRGRTSSSSSSSSSSSPQRRRPRQTKDCADEERGRLNEDELIAQFSVGKTFLDQVGVLPEVAFREDRQSQKALLKTAEVPGAQVAYYKVKQATILGAEKARWAAAGVKKRRRRNEEAPKALRFHQRAYVKRFAKARVIDMTARRTELREMAGADVIPLEDLEEVSGDAEASALGAEGAVTIHLGGVHERTRELNRRLRLEPQNVDLWLELVDFQDVGLLHHVDFDASEDAGDSSQKGQKKKKKKGNVMVKQKAVIEKKLAILKSALDQNPKSIALSVRRLELSRELLDNNTLDRQWKELIFLFPKQFDLYRLYLRFASSNFTTFSISRVASAYKSALAKLKQAHVQSFTWAERPQDLEDQMGQSVVHLCHFWSRSGFRERAVALFQGMIELNLFSPEFPGYYALEDRLALFEPFWESSSPRFGEPGVVGWAAVMKSKHNSSIEAEGVFNSSPWEDDMLAQAGTEKVHRHRLWLQLELGRERHQWCPWRSHEDEPDDPDRQVAYDDLAPFLFQFAERHQPFKLIVSFLHFLGLGECWRDEPFLLSNVASETVSSYLGVLSPEALGTDLVGWKLEINIEVLPKMCPDATTTMGDHSQGYQMFCRNVFSQGSKVLAEPFKTQLIRLWLRFELHVSMAAVVTAESADQAARAAKKKAKAKELKILVMSLLKNDQHNLEVYMEYARIEYQIGGGYKSAWKILETALLSQQQKQQASLLQELYCRAVALHLQELLKKSDGNQESGDEALLVDRTLWLLSLAAGKSKYNKQGEISKADLLLRAKEAQTTLQAEVKEALLSNKTENAEDVDRLKQTPVSHVPAFVQRVFLAAWLTYFTDGDLTGAQQFLDFVYKQIESAAPLTPTRTMCLAVIMENVLKTRLDLTRFAARSDALLLRQCRLALQSAVRAFPCNEYFLQCLLDLNVQPSVVDATWRTLTSLLLAKTSGQQVASPLPHVYAAKLLVRNFARQNVPCSSEGGNAASGGAVSYLHRAQCLLEQFVAGEPGRHSPLLWRLLLWVTHTLGRLQERAATPGQDDTDPAAASKTRENVDTVFYRAMQDCPGVKAICLDVIGCLNAMDERAQGQEGDVKRILDILTEKEGRVRLPLEELDVLLEKEEDEEEEEDL